ncbi:Flagellar capping protein FliD [Anaerovirgula multivorans]|uniref:Filament cap protein n=1 Tax=Anaerovirgula multivorans TaxID=312168 RepID=A0A239EV77_9FIRM|nr:flagellar filament capping protein FliD [Anaerovirgula multivorans]SNS48331.1 Flagellar capping protein FliD [Anaerovirgula multivorans]
MVMRIGGLASGLDTESIIQTLMKTERIRLDKYLQKEQKLKWRQDTFFNINRTMANFILDTRKTLGLTTSTSTGTLLSNSLTNLNWVKSATSSNESAVKATANANAMAGTYEIEVEQLAEVASISSESLNGWLDENLKFKENDILKDDQNVTFRVTTKAGSQDITIKKGMSINNLVNQLNNAKAGDSDKNLGIRATYDAGLNKMLISTRETGSSNFITVEDVTGNFAEEIFKLGNGLIQSDEAIDVIPQNGEFKVKIDGEEKFIDIIKGETLEAFAARVNESDEFKGYVRASVNNGKLTIMAINDATVEIVKEDGVPGATDILKLQEGPINRSATGGTVTAKYLQTGSFAINVAGTEHIIEVEKNWTLGHLEEAINMELNGVVSASINADGGLVLTKAEETVETVEIVAGDYAQNYLNIPAGEITESVASTDTIEANYVAAGSFTMEINGHVHTITIGENTKFEDLAGKINQQLQDEGITPDMIEVTTSDNNRLTLNINGNTKVLLGEITTVPPDEPSNYLRDALKLDIGPIVGTSEGDIVNKIEKEASDDFTIKVDGQNVEINFSEGSLDDLAAAITEQTGGKVTASNVDGKLQLELTGASEAEVLGTYASDVLGLPTGEKMTSQTGQDAVIKFNGETVEKSTNDFTVFGINLQLQKADTTATIRVDTDVDSVVDKVKGFVEEYNALIDMVNGLTTEKTYRDFQPLSDEEKAAMSEKDIELWEEKAKSGLLRNDPALTRMLQDMRSSLYEKVENVSGSFNHITQIGITTGAYQDGGKLVIDEEKLRKAISEDPDGVVDLLFKSPASGLEDKEKMQDSGLVQRIYDGMINGMKEVIRQSGPGDDASLLRNVRSNILLDFVSDQSSISLLDRDLKSLNSRIVREQDMLTRKENRYWQQYTALEKALSQMQNQGSWMTSQLGSGQ